MMRAEGERERTKRREMRQKEYVRMEESKIKMCSKNVDRRDTQTLHTGCRTTVAAPKWPPGKVVLLPNDL